MVMLFDFILFDMCFKMKVEDNNRRKDNWEILYCLFWRSIRLFLDDLWELMNF